MTTESQRDAEHKPDGDLTGRRKRMQRRHENGKHRRIEIMPAAGIAHLVRIATVEKRGTGFRINGEVGPMLVDPLSVEEFASLLAYLESLKPN